MILDCRNEFGLYTIEAPDSCQVRLDSHSNDFLIVPDPHDPDVPYILVGEYLIEAARCEDFGLRLLCVAPLN